MNWKEKLKKHWLTLLVALLWFASGTLWIIQADSLLEYINSVLGYACTICWGAIFYKEMKKDS